MIRPPLFGKDSSPQYTAPRVSAIGTSVLTVVFFLVMILTPAPKPKQKYETVRIVLDTTPVEKVLEKPGEPAAENPEPAPMETSAPAPELVAESTSVQEIKTPEPAPAPKPVVKQEAKPAQKVSEKVESKPISKPKTEEPKYTKRPDTPLKKSVDDLINEVADSRPNFVQSEPDWDSMFSDYTTEETPVKTPTVQKVENALGGAAAKASEKTNDRQSTTTVKSTETTTTADSKTTGNLQTIAATTFTNKTYTGSNNSMSMKTGSTSSGETSVSMNDGSNRILIKPREPKISIDAESAKNINGEPTVKITFTVLPDGTVPESSVEISPRSLLTNEIISDIAFQLSTWKFQAGSSKATASFDFTIKKR